MKRVNLILMVIVLVWGVTASVSAHEQPDLSRNGSITLTMDWEGEPIDSGSLTLCRVGDIVVDDGNYGFALIEALRGYDLSLQNLNDAALSSALAEAVRNEGLAETTQTVRNGQVCFTDVIPGLYVVFQDQENACEGFTAISPFLISMPQNEDGHYVTDIVASPKVPLKTDPTTSTEPAPTQPTGPSLPQTGQLNWPIPVLVVCGVALFAYGWHLYFGRRKETYEK